MPITTPPKDDIWVQENPQANAQPASEQEAPLTRRQRIARGFHRFMTKTWVLLLIAL